MDSELIFELARRAQRKSLRRRRANAQKAATGAATSADVSRLSPAQRRGAQYEERALSMLMRAGLRPISRNLRCKVGEIDLVMRDGDILVIVEVRARAQRRFGGAAASVDARKQARLRRAAACVLPDLTRRYWNGREPAVRFDVVTFDDDVPAWLPNAFTLPWP